MAEQLKQMFNAAFIDRLGIEVKAVDSDFNTNTFKKNVLSNEWESLELKARAAKIAAKLEEHLPYPFAHQISIIQQVAPKFSGFQGIIFPTFVEHFGLDDPALSIRALKVLTAYSSSEFAIRPFLIRYPETIEKLYAWSLDENFHVRRLASEGCRPLLPWAMKLGQYVEDPLPLIRILRTLKNDPEDYVYRSVANNLNDISKHHPQLVLDLCREWVNESKTTRWVAKHALRTLLKAGNQEAMQLFGFGSIAHMQVNHFKIDQLQVLIGQSTHFFCTAKNNGKTGKFRFEYSIGYLKKNGQHNEKVFQIREVILKTDEIVQFEKKVDFKNLSTRKHYPGKHFITLKINGIPQNRIEFELL